MEGVEDDADRLRRLMVVRAFVVTVILGVTFAVQAWVPPDYQGPYSRIYTLISAQYGLLIVQGLLAARGLERRPRLAAGLQFTVDVLFLTALVALTGGASSIFSSLYLLVALGAALVLGRVGAYVAAGISSAAFAALVASEYLGVGLVRYDLVPDLIPMVDEIVPITTSVLVAANLVVAFLASHLVDEVRVRDSAVRRSSERLRELSALQTRIVQSISSGVLTVDGSGRITSINRAGRDILGLAEEEILFKPIEVLSPDFYKHLGAGGEVRASAGDRWETSFVRRDGERRYLGFATSPLAAEPEPDGSDESGHVVIFQDLTQIKELERRSAEDARLRSIGELAAAIAHEIRNPLASMSGCVELLRADPLIGERGGRLLAVVLRESDRLNALITDFLAYARPDRVADDPVDLSVLIEDFLLMLTSGADRPPEVEIEGRIEPNLVVRGDAQRLQQLLLNVVRNAVEAVAPRGRVRVRARRLSGARVEIRVEDDGPGVAPEDRDRIFEPFYTTKQGGTGLGLAVVHRIVGVHGGRLDVGRSSLGGACFRIDLRAAEGTVADDEAPRAARGECAGDE